MRWRWSPTERVRISLRRLAVVLGLCGVAVAQPVLDVFGDSPATFQFHRVDSAGIVWFALVVAFVPPLALWLVAVVADRLDRRAGLFVHLGSVAVLLAAAGIQVGKELGVEAAPMLGLWGAAIAAAGTWAYWRFDVVAGWARILAVLPVVAVALFLFRSPVADLVRPPTIEPVAAQTVEDEQLPSVVMILLDELPTQSVLADDGGIDPVRFPNLAAFAEDATWYRRFTTVSPFTQTAVPAMLTGQYPSGGDPLWTEHPDNLFTLLGGTHHLTVAEALTKLCGLEQCDFDPVPPPAPGDSDVSAETVAAPPSGSDRRLGDVFASARELWWDRVSLSTSRSEALDDFEEEIESTYDDVEVVDAPATEADLEVDPDAIAFRRFVDTQVVNQPTRHRQFLDAISPSDEPVLYFVHLTLPHHPWRFRQDGRRYTLPSGDANPFSPFNETPWQVQLNQQRHLLQATYADRLLGSLLDRLQAADVYDDAVVVVASDHGVDFEVGEHHRELSEDTVDGVAYAPLLVKAPGQTIGRVDDTNVMAVDVLPTLADLVGVEIPWSTDGSPADAPDIAERGRTKVFFDYTDAFDPELRGVEEFDDDAVFEALVADRFPSIGGDDDVLAGLYEVLDGADLLGRAFDEVVGGRAAGIAEVADLGALVDPPADSAPLGVVAGHIEGADGRTVVVAVDGTVVGLSPTYELRRRDGAFAVLLPDDALAAGGNEVRAGLLDPATGLVDELDVVGSG